MSAEGVPVAWLCRSEYDDFGLACQSEAEAWRECRDRGPEYTVVPLYTHPAASAESIRAEVIEECAKAAEGIDELAVTADWDNSDDIACEVKKAIVAKVRALSALEKKKEV